MATNFENWYNDFLVIAKQVYRYPEKRIHEMKGVLHEYFAEGLLPNHAAEQELGCE